MIKVSSFLSNENFFAGHGFSTTDVKAELGTTSASWSQHHFVAIGNPERHVRKASHHGSKQQ